MFVIVVELQLRNNDYECFTSAILWLVLTLKIPEFLTRFCLYQYIDEHKFLPNVLAVRMYEPASTPDRVAFSLSSESW